MSPESLNNFTDHVLNPHNPERSAGGSSGGEGALISTGSSPAGIGSDIGGST